MSDTQHDLILLGAGGHASVVADAATHLNWNILGFYDDNACATLPSLKNLGTIEDALKENKNALFHAAVGDGKLREDWIADIPVEMLARIIHPSAIVSETAQLDGGVFVGPGAIINPRTTISRCAIINSGAVVEHDCVVGEFSHIAPRSVLGGKVKVGNHTLIGIGSTVLPGIEVGKNVIIGGGAVVIEDLPDNVTAWGVPAKIAIGV